MSPTDDFAEVTISYGCTYRSLWILHFLTSIGIWRSGAVSGGIPLAFQRAFGHGAPVCSAVAYS
jgi:hypothetical protein